METGSFTIMVGKSSRDIRLCAKVGVESTQPIKKVFGWNSTVGDVMADPKGAEIMGRMMQAMNPIPVPEEPEEGGVFEEGGMQAMMNYMPLRGLVMFAGGGKEAEAGIQQMIDALNA